MGLFKVDMINTRQMSVNVILDYKYGLQLKEGVLTNCRGWLGLTCSVVSFPYYNHRRCSPTLFGEEAESPVCSG